MGFPVEEMPEDREIATLKRAKGKIETELDSERNEALKLKDRVRELELEVREGLTKAQQEAAKAVQAEEALRKRTDAYNTLRNQKENAEVALREAEEKVKEQAGEIKRLSYHLEVIQARSAAPSQIALDKAALEKRVHGLTMELQRVQMELEKEKENKGNAEAAKVGTSKIARPSSRASLTGTDSKLSAGPATRGRFGYSSSIPAPASASKAPARPPSSLGSTRPPSSLANHSAIPTLKPPGTRRTSVSATPASSTADVGNTAQLEVDLSSAKSSILSLEKSLNEAQSTISTLESTLSTTQAKLQTKSDELLRVENQLMALEQTSSEEASRLRGDLEDARDELEGARDELREFRDGVQRELDETLRDSQEERAALADKVERLKDEVARMTEERTATEGNREELERLLLDARADLDTLALVEEERDEAEQELAWTEEQLQLAEKEKEKLAQDLEDADNAIEELEQDLEAMSKELEAAQAETAGANSDSPQDPTEAMDAMRCELEERLAAVEADRDDLVAALASASKAHQEASMGLARHRDLQDAMQEDKQRVVDELDNVKQRLTETESAHNALLASTSSLDDLTSQLADLRAQLVKKEQQIVDLSARLPELDTLAAARDDLASQLDAHSQASAKKDVVAADLTSRVAELETALAAITAERDERIDTVNEQGDEVATLQASTDEVEQLRATLSTTEDNLATARQQVVDLKADRSAVEKASDDLRDELARQVKTRDDTTVDVSAQISQLEADLAEAIARLETTTDQLEQAHAARAVAKENHDPAVERIAALEAEVAQLGKAVESERGSLAEAKAESQAVEEALMDAKQQLKATEGKLADLVVERESLHAQLAELELAAVRLEDMNAALNEELDEMRAAEDEKLIANADEISELHARLREQDAIVEDLERQANEVDSLRRVLAATESQADSLGWDLRDARSALDKQKRHSADQVARLTQRAETAEASVERLRAELDDARHNLSNVQDTLDQLQGDLADSQPSTACPTPVPVPATSAPATPANLAQTGSSSAPSPRTPSLDPSHLVERLRDERANLRNSLEFARAEAGARIEVLQKRLREAEESKATELSRLQLDLMDKEAAYATEREANDKIEDSLREANRDRANIEERLEQAERRAKDAEARITDVLKRLAEEQHMRQEERSERENAWALEGELEAAAKSVDKIRAERDNANLVVGELRQTLLAVQTERDETSAELAALRTALATASVRIAELEELATARGESREVDTGDALADFASFCDTLRSDATQLEQTIAHQSAAIVDYQAKIAFLQLNLAVRVALEDDEDDDLRSDVDTATPLLANVDEDVQSSMDDLDKRMSLQTAKENLATAVSARAALEARLVELQTELTTVIQSKEASFAVISELEQQLDAVSAEVVEREGRSRRADEHATGLAAQLAVASERIIVLEGEFDGAKAVVADLRAQVADAVNREARLLKEQASTDALHKLVQEADSARKAAVDALLAARTESVSFAADLTIATEDLASTKDLLAATSASLSNLQQESASFAIIRADLEQQVASLEARARSAENTVEQAAQLRDEAEQRASSAEATFLQAKGDSASAKAARDEQEQALRTAQAELDAVKTNLSAQLAAAHDEISALTAKLDQAEGSSARITQVEGELADARAELNEMAKRLEEESRGSEQARAALVAAEAKAETAVELSTKEIQTLRKLSKSSAAEAQALTEEVEGLRSQIGQLTSHLQEANESKQQELRQLRDQTQQNIKEVIEYSEACEREKAAAEAEVKELLAEVDRLKTAASSAAPSSEAVARITELERLLETKMLDVEEADEKLLDALKAQKKYATQIERLKAKVASLQRDLAAAKASASAPTVLAAAPLPSAPAPSSVSRKRPAPSDFDGSTATTPRPVLASSVPAIPLDKENARASSAHRQARPLSAKKPTETLVPLKPEHHVPVRSHALKPVDANSTPAAPFEPVAIKAPTAVNKRDTLMSRMHALQKNTAA
ncbi:cell wall surface anchor family protein [Rhodotorula toruloides]|uniref:Cell wall surface anchor family protein n=1 Tax=Rhodotorula toruloides TaxID=5286 RepID=A0A511KNL3_RHOTO|nr:cell wall surface anchor family protein [Rhodotorula toruloides]